jgi:hypothetical protein
MISNYKTFKAKNKIPQQIAGFRSFSASPGGIKTPGSHRLLP